MYSALKRDGKALYEYARAGLEVERQPRRVKIQALDVLGVAGERFQCRVKCSKGTYIRSLAMDIGNVLGCGAHLSGLVREATGPYTLGNAISLEAFESASEALRPGFLLPVDAFVQHLPRQMLAEAEAARFLHGQAVRLAAPGGLGLYRAYLGERFLGLGSLDTDGLLAPVRLLAT